MMWFYTNPLLTGSLIIILDIILLKITFYKMRLMNEIVPISLIINIICFTIIFILSFSELAQDMLHCSKGWIILFVPLYGSKPGFPDPYCIIINLLIPLAIITPFMKYLTTFFVLYKRKINCWKYGILPISLFISSSVSYFIIALILSKSSPENYWS